MRPLILLFLLAFPLTARGYVVDGIAAVVAGKVITESDVGRAVEFEAARRGIKDGGEMKELRAEALDALIDRELLLQEAYKFNIVSVAEDEVDKAVATVKAGYGSDEAFEQALKEEEMTPAELRQDVKDQLLAVKYVERRVSFFVRVGLDDQKKYYEEHRASFGDKAFSNVQDEIYRLLKEKETDKKLKDYMKELRAKSVVIVKEPVAAP